MALGDTLRVSNHLQLHHSPAKDRRVPSGLTLRSLTQYRCNFKGLQGWSVSLHLVEGHFAFIPEAAIPTLCAAPDSIISLLNRVDHLFV